MYRNLSPHCLGLSCRQSELIELALTHGFGGFDLDLSDFQTQVESKGLEAAARLIKSANIKLNGSILPVELSAVEGRFESELQMAQPLFETAQALGVEVVQAVVEPGNPQRPYHENFEFHRQRLQRYSQFLADYGLRLGLNFVAPPEHRESFPQPFVSKPEELVTLIKLVGRDNIGMVVDLWHWAVAGASHELLTTLSPSHITEVRLAGFPPGVQPTSARDNQRSMPSLEGVIPTSAALTRLAQMQYGGPVTLAPDPSEMQVSRREEVVVLAVETFDSLFEAAGLDKRGRIKKTEPATASDAS